MSTKKDTSYEAIRAEIARINQTIEAKRADVAALEADITEKRGQLDELCRQIHDSEHALAFGNMTTQAFLELKQQRDALDLEIKSFAEVVALHKKALALLDKEKLALSSNSGRAITHMAKKQADAHLDELIRNAGSLLNQWVSAVCISGSHDFAKWTESERRAAREKFYVSLAEALFEKLPLPNQREARQAFVAEINRNGDDQEVDQAA